MPVYTLIAILVVAAVVAFVYEIRGMKRESK